MRVGDKVRIQRDEDKYPSRGTWPQFRGKTGKITSVNQARTVRTMVWETPEKKKIVPADVRIPAEYGVSFTRSQHTDAWFRPYEVVKVR